MICRCSKFTFASTEPIDAELMRPIGGVSASNGLFNLLPLRPLSGGNLTLVAIEDREFCARPTRLTGM
jgi:hypothetical protein